MPGPVSFVALIAISATAVYMDLRHAKVPNWLCAAGFVSGSAILWSTRGAEGLASSLAGSLMGLSILLVPFLLHMVGGGDVKFLTAAGAIVGWRLLWVSFLAGASLAGALALALIVLRDRSLDKLRQRLVLVLAGVWRKPDSLKGLETGGGKARERRKAEAWCDIRIPYAVPLSMGLIVVCSIRVFA